MNHRAFITGGKGRTGAERMISPLELFARCKLVTLSCDTLKVVRVVLEAVVLFINTTTCAGPQLTSALSGLYWGIGLDRQLRKIVTSFETAHHQNQRFEGHICFRQVRKLGRYP
jgi:hypothetical protein